MITRETVKCNVELGVSSIEMIYNLFPSLTRNIMQEICFKMLELTQGRQSWYVAAALHPRPMFCFCLPPKHSSCQLDCAVMWKGHSRNRML